MSSLFAPNYTFGAENYAKCMTDELLAQNHEVVVLTQSEKDLEK